MHFDFLLPYLHRGQRFIFLWGNGTLTSDPWPREDGEAVVCIRKVKGHQDGQTPGMPVPEFLKLYQLQVRGCFWQYSTVTAWTLLTYFEPASWQVTAKLDQTCVSQPYFEM